MPIDVNELPEATNDDLKRAGQHLLYSDPLITRLRRVTRANYGILVASESQADIGSINLLCGNYRTLTKEQAIELAIEMPHVDTKWHEDMLRFLAP